MKKVLSVMVCLMINGISFTNGTSLSAGNQENKIAYIINTTGQPISVTGPATTKDISLAFPENIGNDQFVRQEFSGDPRDMYEMRYQMKNSKDRIKFTNKLPNKYNIFIIYNNVKNRGKDDETTTYDVFFADNFNAIKTSSW